MKGIEFFKGSYIELVLKVFLPILIIILLVGIALFVYSKNAKKRGTPNYKDKVNISFSIISIVITLVLIAVAVCFSVNFINIMEAKNLIENNKFIYYTVIGSPIIPFIYLIYIIIGFVRIISNNHNNNEMKDDVSNEKSEVINSVEKMNIKEDEQDDVEVL